MVRGGMTHSCEYNTFRQETFPCPNCTLILNLKCLYYSELLCANPVNLTTSGEPIVPIAKDRTHSQIEQWKTWDHTMN